MWKDLKLITDGFYCYIVCVTFCNDSKKQPEEMNKLLHNSAPMQLLKDVSMFAFKPQCSLWPKVCRQSHELLFRSYNILKLRCIMFIKMTRCRSRTSCHLDQLIWLDQRSHTRHHKLKLGDPHCCNFPPKVLKWFNLVTNLWLRVVFHGEGSCSWRGGWDEAQSIISNLRPASAYNEVFLDDTELQQFVSFPFATTWFWTSLIQLLLNGSKFLQLVFFKNIWN